ncbi:WD40 repeat domain-containing serine/threonine protein kinase [Stieleria varia]|uniref:Serine/threonine-protein kinase PknD n=1 Tax=Stieleria varia TaxID=2528005 RepID=A0A5C6AZG2_9BACT|nr:protein kinase [Stieleria varia]TWU05028.1 Serine/threonine-protein kinase PknD [Stieleria varia]
MTSDDQPDPSPPIKRDVSNDETIDGIGASMDSTVDPLAQTIDPFGIQESANADSGNIPPNVNLEQTIAVGAASLRPTPVGPGTGRSQSRSVMTSADVGRTINPRELNAEDAAFWGSIAAAGVSKANQGEVTDQRPAAERSISETKLQLRQRDLAPPTRSVDEPSDYRLVRLLGRGGMGNVYIAKQMSLDRLLAVKVVRPLPKEKQEKLQQSGRLEQVQNDRRQQFLSEAVVTGDLDHPNIVPIHDVAVAADNTLFYAMKRVVGRPWSDVIAEKSRDENLEILLKVGDALAFAHTRGVVHRDIKPENIMLGDFGEVLVMDWGLALAQPNFEKSESITHTAGLGGTPAFMAPEMATGPLKKIGPASDIYLLGATLYYIITGVAPHHGDDVSQCIRAVASNKIREVEPRHQGELLNIALKAMETEPDARYRSVIEFQTAIRLYRSHAESISLESNAREHLTRAKSQSGYDSYARAMFGFEQAIALWPDNVKAVQGLAESRLAHAQAAYDNGDFDAGISILDPENPDHSQLLQQLQLAIQERDSHKSRLTLFKRLAVASLAFIVVGGAVALYLINNQRRQAIDARLIAEQEKKNTQDALKVADANYKRAEFERERAVAGEDAARLASQEAMVARNEAVEERMVADDLRVKAEGLQRKAEQSAEEALSAKLLAETRRQEAETQRMAALDSAEQARAEKAKAEYEAYLSQIGLANARIERNEFDDARRILTSLRNSITDRAPAWEWRWLWAQTNQSVTTTDLAAAVTDFASSPDGRHVYAVDASGVLHAFHVESDGTISPQGHRQVELPGIATSLSISTDGRSIALGMNQADVRIYGAENLAYIRSLSGHQDTVTDVVYISDRLLLSASNDRTVIVWDAVNRRKLDQCWHIAPVRQIDTQRIKQNPTQSRVFVAAVSDSSSGRVVAWRLTGDGQTTRVSTERLGEFLQHPDRVTAVAISDDGKNVVSGDVGGNLYQWDIASLRPTDFDASIASAIRRANNSDSPATGTKQSANTSRSNQTPYRELIDSNDEMLVSASNGPSEQRKQRAHGDAIRALRFSRDGRFVLSSSDDYTLKRWENDKNGATVTFRGHGGWVTAIEFAGARHERLLSSSADRTIRSWNPNTYLNSYAKLDPQQAFSASHADQSAKPLDREAKPHADEILSASFDRLGTRIVSASRDHTARILAIDPQTLNFKPIASIGVDRGDRLSEGTEYLSMSAVVDPNRGRVFVGSADSIVRIWDLNSGTQRGQMRGTGLNNTLALSGDGNLLLTGSSGGDAKAILWDVSSERIGPVERFRLGGHQEAVTALAISSNGKRIFTGDRSGRGIVWDAETGTQLGEPIDLLRGYRINDVKFAADDRVIWIAADDQQLTAIDIDTRHLIKRLEHRGFVTSVSIAEDDSYAVTVSESVDKDSVRSIVTLWDLSSGAQFRLADAKGAKSAAQQNERITSARISRDGLRVAMTRQGKSGRTGELAVIGVEQAGRAAKWLQMPGKIGTPLAACLLSPNSVLTLNGDAAFRWNIDTMAHEKSYRAHAAVTQAVFSADGNLVATGSRSLKLWNSATGEPIDKLESPHQGPVRALAFAPDNDAYRFATAGDDGVVRRWQWSPTDGFTMLGEVQLSQSPILCLQYSPDGRQLAAGTTGHAWLWSVDQAGNRLEFTLEDRTNINCLAFSPDGKWLIAGGDDKQARLWSLDESTTKPILFTGHADRVESVAIIQDQSQQMRVLTCSRDKSTRLWDPRVELGEAVGREILTLRKHTQGVTSVGVTSDGQLVMTAGRDGAVILWPAPFD